MALTMKARKPIVGPTTLHLHGLSLQAEDASGMLSVTSGPCMKHSQILWGGKLLHKYTAKGSISHLQAVHWEYPATVFPTMCHESHLVAALETDWEDEYHSDTGRRLLTDEGSMYQS